MRDLFNTVLVIILFTTLSIIILSILVLYILYRVISLPTRILCQRKL